MAVEQHEERGLGWIPGVWMVILTFCLSIHAAGDAGASAAVSASGDELAGTARVVGSGDGPLGAAHVAVARSGAVLVAHGFLSVWTRSSSRWRRIPFPPT